MLSYRHAYHAGNHADLLKHYLLSRVLAYYNGKQKPYDYIDTHAGAGQYDLSGDYAQKNCEYDSGFTRLLAATDLPTALAAWRDELRALLPAADTYPGSVLIAAKTLPPPGKLHLYELHPADYQALQNNLHPVKIGRASCRERV